MHPSFWFILLLCLITHFQLFFSVKWVTSFGTHNDVLYYNLFQGLAYLLYPVCGWIAEVCFSNFKMIKWSFIILLASSVTIVVIMIFSVIYPFYQITISYTSGHIIELIFLLIITAGLGMFESNAIQFGMDQMLEASSEQLSSFIHWYFWCAHIGPLVIFYIALGTFLYFENCRFQMDHVYKPFHTIFYFFVLIILSIETVIYIFAVVYIYWSKQSHQNDQKSRNSMKIIYEVLKYSWKHKIPELRSAFTFWENDIPSQIDLGKEKYGGPFTYEEVENVKSFFRLLLLILSLFGFQLSGDGYSLTYYIMNKAGCPSIIPYWLLISNPQHIPLVTVILGVPVFQCIKKHFARFIPNMLTRLWIGLFISMVNETLQLIFIIMIKDQDFKCPEIYNEGFIETLSGKCFSAVFNITKNSSCEHFCSDPPVSDPTFYYLIFPLLLYGISYLLVFMTVLEFICAQSPNALKGLLIGIWYSTSSVKYMVIGVLDTHPLFLESSPWSIYHGIRGFGIFLSIISFSIIYKSYQYRERNEVVNEQAIIEEQYERELLNNSSEDNVSL